jgi:hypothetical protein
MRWVEPRRQVAREIVRHALQSGELRAGLDPDALYGPFYHRLLASCVWCKWRFQ